MFTNPEKNKQRNESIKFFVADVILNIFEVAKSDVFKPLLILLHSWFSYVELVAPDIVREIV